MRTMSLVSLAFFALFVANPASAAVLTAGDTARYVLPGDAFPDEIGGADPFFAFVIVRTTGIDTGFGPGDAVELSVGTLDDPERFGALSIPAFSTPLDNLRLGPGAGDPFTGSLQLSSLSPVVSELVATISVITGSVEIELAAFLFSDAIFDDVVNRSVFEPTATVVPAPPALILTISSVLFLIAAGHRGRQQRPGQAFA